MRTWKIAGYVLGGVAVASFAAVGAYLALTDGAASLSVCMLALTVAALTAVLSALAFAVPAVVAAVERLVHQRVGQFEQGVSHTVGALAQAIQEPQGRRATPHLRRIS